MAYLRSLIELPNREAAPYFGQRRPTDLYVWPDVLQRKASSDSHAARLPDNRGALPADNPQGCFWRDEDQGRRIAWERQQARIRRAVVLGRPGEGKTLLARMTVRTVAEASLSDLTAHRKRPEEVVLPVCVHLAKVAECGSLEAAVASAVGAALAEACPPQKDATLVARVVRHIVDAVFTERSCLLLDALDEVPDPAPLHSALKPLRHAQCRVVVTSRPYGYDGSVLPFESPVEYELAPFTARQRRLMVSHWFQDDEARRDRMLEWVQGNPQLGDLARNALLLALMCATAASDKLRRKLRRVDLYRLIVRDMVRKVWKEDRLPDDSESVDEMVLLLEGMAWRLFCRDPKGTVFPYRQFDSIARAVCCACRVEAGPKDLLEPLRRAGLVVSPASGHRMFLHRTFLEFLAAEHVAHQPDPLPRIERFLWRPHKNGVVRWQPAAAEMICFLAGCLENPNPLLRRLTELDEQQPDQFRTMLLLAGRALADAEPLAVSRDLARAVAGKVCEIWQKVPGGLQRDQIVPALAHHRGVDALLRVFSGGQAYLQCEAARALGGIGGDRAVKPLARVLAGGKPAADHAPLDLREAAARALGEIGSQQAVPSLLKAFRSPQTALRKVAAAALGKIGSQDAVEPLLSALSKEHGEVRWCAAEALAEIGNRAAVEPLTEALLEMLKDEDQDREIRQTISKTRAETPASEGHVDNLRAVFRHFQCWSAKLMSSLASAELERRLIAELRQQCAGEPGHDKWWVRGGLVLGLGELRSLPAVALLVGMLTDRVWWVREAAALALGQIGDPTATPPLIGRLTDQEELEKVRVQAAVALGTILRAKAVLPLLPILTAQQTPPRLRTTAAVVLRDLVDRRVARPLIGALHDPCSDVCRWAAHVLAHTASQTAVEPLCRALENEPDEPGDSSPVPWIAEALGKTSGGRSGAVLCKAFQERKHHRSAIARALGERGSKRATAILGRALPDSDEEVCSAALRALGNAASQPAVEALLQFAKNSPHVDLRADARSWLSCISLRTGQRIPVIDAT